jgi:prephenate dehydrogenase
MAISYEVIIQVLVAGPTESIENILQRVNHRFSSSAPVTGFLSTKPLLVRLQRV